MTTPVQSGVRAFWLRKHADYQRVYAATRKQHGRQITWFAALRPQVGPNGLPLRGGLPGAPRVGLTVPKALGKAVDRNRIKRRMRAAVRPQLSQLSLSIDIILHPRRTVLTLPYLELEGEVSRIFQSVQRNAEREAAKNAVVAYGGSK